MIGCPAARPALGALVIVVTGWALLSGAEPQTGAPRDPEGAEATMSVRNGTHTIDPQNLFPALHNQWLADILREVLTIKPGMTRAELLKVVEPEQGGIHNRLQRRHVSRKSPYIKVNVRFEAVGDEKNKLDPSPGDKIVEISQPFLEWPIRD